MQTNAIKALVSLLTHAVAPEVRLIAARALHNLNTLNRTCIDLSARPLTRRS
jgi:hypothetical protein